MFVGEEADGGMVILFCYKDTANQIVPPTCFREFDYSSEVIIRYSFKHAYLADWQEVNAQVRRFVTSLSDASAG